MNTMTYDDADELRGALTQAGWPQLRHHVPRGGTELGQLAADFWMDTLARFRRDEKLDAVTAIERSCQGGYFGRHEDACYQFSIAPGGVAA